MHFVWENVNLNKFFFEFIPDPYPDPQHLKLVTDHNIQEHDQWALNTNLGTETYIFFIDGELGTSLSR